MLRQKRNGACSNGTSSTESRPSFVERDIVQRHGLLLTHTKSRAGSHIPKADGGGGLHSFVRPRQSILPITQINLRRTHPHQGAGIAFAVSLPPRKKNSPEFLIRSRSRPSKDRPRETPLGQHISSTASYCPSALSSLHRAQHHLLARKRSATALPQKSPRLPPGFYSGHTPTLRRFNHLADTTQGTGNHPGCHRASCVSHGLRLVGHVAIRCYPEGISRMSALPSRHSFQDGSLMGCMYVTRIGRKPVSRQRTTLSTQPDFWRANVEAPPYPSTTAFRSSAPSPPRLTGKPLRAFHG